MARCRLLRMSFFTIMGFRELLFKFFDKNARIIATYLSILFPGQI